MGELGDRGADEGLICQDHLGDGCGGDCGEGVTTESGYDGYRY